jgi:phenylacetate-CoA ligase
VAGKRFDKMTDALNRYAPVGLSGMSSSLVMLSERVKDSDARFTRNLRGVYSTAEMLHDHQRHIIASTLRPNVFDRYGLREFGGYLAQECEYHNGLHVNSMLVYAEIVRNGELASPGQIGKLILTDLRNYAMPLIRYDTGDLASIEFDCSCGRGFPLIRRLEGRESDFITTKFGLMSARAVTTKFGIEFLEYVRAFQFIQDETAKVTVKVVPARQNQTTLTRRLTHFLENYLDNFEVSLVDAIPPEKSGKRLMFKSAKYRDPATPQPPRTR